MNRIRIGSDIRLNFNVCPDNSGFNVGADINQTNIKQIRCYLVNTEKYYINDEDHKDMFVRIKYPQFYHPTAHNINNAGFPSYHLLPHNVDNYDHFLPDFHDYHWWPGFRGFGIHPERFGPNHNYLPKNWYLAESQVLPMDNMASCIFPAMEQRVLGKYKLVVVVTIYEQGWGRDNLCTYTIDKGNIFELVADESGQSGVIVIDVDEETQENLIKTINAEENSYTLYTGETMYIGGYDVDRKHYGINVELLDDTQHVYNPYAWRYNKLNFISTDSDVSVDECGTIKVSKNNTQNKEVTILVSSSADPDVYTSFTVNVLHVSVVNTLRIGFSANTDVQDFKQGDIYDFSSLDEYPAVANRYSITNDEDGKYLWIVSDSKIDTITSYSVEVPMLHIITAGASYVYRTEMAVLAGDMQIKIEYER